jgi:hypothetical protein
MTDRAALVALGLAELIRTLPEYDAYGDADTAYHNESPFRLAIGRLLKDWGDRLLDIAEFQGSFLSQDQTRTIDTLVECISDVFRLLNCSGRIAVNVQDVELLRELRCTDARIVRLLEESMGLSGDLRRSDMTSRWLLTTAGPFYRRMRRIARQAELRNQLLGLAPPSQRAAQRTLRAVGPRRAERR